MPVSGMNASSNKTDETKSTQNDAVEWPGGDDLVPESKGYPSDQGTGWRKSVGRIMHGVSSTINDNVVVARYGTIATVALLTGYGLYKTPLFFRFRTVSEIPPGHFIRRKLLHGRIVGILEDDLQGEIEKPVKVLIRHLSPIGRLQHRAAFDFSSENSPSALLAGRLEKSKDLLKVEIAGIKAAPHYSNPDKQERQWLHRLAADRTPVTCQLISRRIVHDLQVKKNGATNLVPLGDSCPFDYPPDPKSEQFAVCHVKYRPPRSIFRQDLASVLVEHGRAMVASGMHTKDPSRPTADGSTKVECIRRDAAYLERLEKAEFEAVKSRNGVWNDERVRSANSDLVGEADFEVNAGTGEKVLRWMREKAGF